ncbi:MAG: peroxidase family protein [Planktomarina sp.]
MIAQLTKLAARMPKTVAWVLRFKPLRMWANKKIINRYSSTTAPRPLPFSLKSSYTSWASLTDMSYTGRQLPEDTSGRVLPDLQEVTDLWRRRGPEIPSEDTSVFFAFFAQWFTDSFLRTDLSNRKKNTSNHEIDLCQIYGLTPEATEILRSKVDGKLRCQEIDGHIYPPFMFDPDKTTKENWVWACPEYEHLHERKKLEFIFQRTPEERLKYMFLTGLEHGNSSIGYTAVNTIFLREHNRLCDVLKAENPEWDDDRLFETVRMINIAVLLKLVLCDYINHVGSIDFPFELDPSVGEDQPWKRPNWISIEFDLLYRWHSMVPDKIRAGDNSYEAADYRSNPVLLMELGVENVLEATAQQKAGKIGLLNTHDMFFEPFPSPFEADKTIQSIQARTVQMARDAKLMPMNAYRQAYGLKPYKAMAELTDNPELEKELTRLYGTVDNVEWFTGLFAEWHDENCMTGDLMTRMVGYDAFTHVFSNPLASPGVFNEDTFTKTGMHIIQDTTRVSQVIARNSDWQTDKNLRFKVS